MNQLKGKKEHYTCTCSKEVRPLHARCVSAYYHPFVHTDNPIWLYGQFTLSMRTIAFACECLTIACECLFFSYLDSTDEAALGACCARVIW